jgi:hypothetical protein
MLLAFADHAGVLKQGDSPSAERLRFFTQPRPKADFASCRSINQSIQSEVRRSGRGQSVRPRGRSCQRKRCQLVSFPKVTLCDRYPWHFIRGTLRAKIRGGEDDRDEVHRAGGLRGADSAGGHGRGCATRIGGGGVGGRCTRNAGHRPARADATLADLLEQVRLLTDKPFGVNFIVARYSCMVRRPARPLI